MIPGRGQTCLEWAPLAFEDREAIFTYIEQDSPRMAVEVDRRIAEQAEMLCDHPLMGRSGRIEGTRELVLARIPYILVYLVLPDGVRVLRALHASRDWPEAFLP